MAVPPVSIAVMVNPADIKRITKRLDNWKDKPLAARMQKAVEGGLKLLVNPIRGGSPVVSGALRKSVKTSKLRKRTGEVFAYKVGPTARHRHLVIRGTSRGVTANPFVDRAVNPLMGQVDNFIDEQIRKF